MGQTCNISVTGYGALECEADILDMSFHISRIDIDSGNAQVNVNTVINKIINALKEIGIKTKEIITTPMSFNEKFEWEKSKNVYKGIEVSQSVICRLRELKKNIGKIIKIIDFVGNCGDNINFNQRFYLEDFASAHKYCREKAYNDALAKAEHYASLSKLSIKGVKNISEYKKADNENGRYDEDMCYSDVGSSDDKSTNFSVRKVYFDMTLYVDFFAE